MSTATAVRLPRRAPEQAPQRHLDIAPTRAQKRARPRIYAALVAVGGIVVILLAQLLMSIVLADGAYRITSLQRDNRDLTREQHAAQERLEQLSSTQSLIDNATALGMASSGNPVFLDVATGQALGTAGAPKGQIVGAGGNLIGNALLGDGSNLLDPAAIAAAQAAEHGTTLDATPTTTTAQSGVAPVQGGTGTLPSPTTR
ncbi:hypothetical protein [Protaetiibacter mangrovi]|uniref:Cell division protein FtsL n=1 Tax=Protaetiibacter mangrovi TaxID=2970926 RepID=A0ABT1ZB78_9MICO|nr:hypothetical protein [Protaetiibacter mangrovi]MCS0497953.1 hypothetical protein [Protaetiibacter mangrovi]TPX02765.1 hypothetical protein FJ656_20675 [Schumannella luteola]